MLRAGCCHQLASSLYVSQLDAHLDAHAPPLQASCQSPYGSGRNPILPGGKLIFFLGDSRAAGSWCEDLSIVHVNQSVSVHNTWYDDTQYIHSQALCIFNPKLAHAH